MQPLPPEELLKYATHFATEKKTIALGKSIAAQIRIQLDQFVGESEFDRNTVLDALGDAVIRNLEQYRVGADRSTIGRLDNAEHL